MKLSEIKEKINKNNLAISELKSEIYKLSSINNDLNNDKNRKLIEFFKEFIETGSTYNINNYTYFDGVQIGINKNDTKQNPYFIKGDIIELVRKNNKSVVIKCKNKLETVLVDGIKTTVSSNPGWLFRININDLYNKFTVDKEFKDSFEKYINRKENLEILGI